MPIIFGSDRQLLSLVFFAGTSSTRGVRISPMFGFTVLSLDARSCFREIDVSLEFDYLCLLLNLYLALDR